MTSLIRRIYCGIVLLFFTMPFANSHPFFEEGMSWYLYSRQFYSTGNTMERFDAYYIDGTTVLSDGNKTKNMYRADINGSHLVAYLITDEPVVKFTLPADSVPYWRTLYDFTNQVGRMITCYIPWSSDSVDFSIDEISSDREEFGIPEYYVKAFYHHSVCGHDYWLYAIGSECGPLEASNCCLDGTCSKLVLVKYKGKIIYQSSYFDELPDLSIVSNCCIGTYLQINSNKN